MKCSACGFEAQPGMSFCGQCGTRLPRTCPNCGFENPAGYRFCGMCGSSLTDLTTPAALPQVSPPQETKPRPGAAAPTIPESTQPALSAPLAAPRAPAPLAGERRIATSILADVHRSTDLMEQIGTEAWVELMNRVLQLLAAEVYRFGGRVDQFRGDGLVAFFGATDAHEDDPERAILAALAMQRSVDAAMCNNDLKVRVGVNTGEVIVGSVGEAGRHSEDTAMGGGVALAARMETAAEPGTVLVSADTYRLVESRFEWLPLGEIAVKGISKPVAVYRPLRLQTAAEATQPRDLALPLIPGRDLAFAALQECVDALCGGRGGIVFVTGDKGMGKSLLVERLQQYYSQFSRICVEDQAEGRDKGEALPVASMGSKGIIGDATGPLKPGSQRSALPLRWLTSHCRSYDQTTPYALWIGLLRGWLEALSSADAETSLADALRRRSEILWGDRAERTIVHTWPPCWRCRPGMPALSA